MNASDLPNRGLAVVWRANESALKNGDWSPVHAFPVKKHAEAVTVEVSTAPGFRCNLIWPSARGAHHTSPIMENAIFE